MTVGVSTSRCAPRVIRHGSLAQDAVRLRGVSYVKIDHQRFVWRSRASRSLSGPAPRCTSPPTSIRIFSVANCHTYTFAREHVANAADQPAAFGNPLNADRLARRDRGETWPREASPRRADEARRTAWSAMPWAPVRCSTITTPAGAHGWGFGYGWGRRGWGGGWGYDGPWVENETRIAVDVFDARAHKAIWHGAVSQTMSV